MSANNLLRLLAVVLAGLLVAAPAPAALAQSSGSSKTPKAKAQAARSLYNQGRTQYDLGDFDEAIRLFKQGYQLDPKPAFLYNIAQAYRQLGDCQALFFYKNYLTVSGKKAKRRRVVEARIKELTATCKAIEDLKGKPPPGSMDPDDEKLDGDSAPSDGDRESNGDGADTDESEGRAPGTEVADSSSIDEDDGDEDFIDSDSALVESVPDQPSKLLTTVELGSTFLTIADSTGQLDADRAYFSASVGFAYPIHFGRVGIDLGALVTYTDVPWTNNGMDGRDGLAGVFGNVGVRYWILSKLGLRAHVGLGALLLVGVDEGSILLNEGASVENVPGMFNVRTGVDIEYLITRNFVLTVSPISYSYSQARDDLREGIESFTLIELGGGLGYRF